MKKIFLTTVTSLFIAINAFSYSGGNGSELFPYEISSKADMQELATNVNGGQNYAGIYFKLTRDLTGASDTITTIIGGISSSAVFSGIFDGGGYEIAVKINSVSGVGIFGYISGATIKNLGVSGSIIKTSNPSGFVGGICGEIVSGVNKITNCYNTATITSTVTTTTTSINYTGGICGYVSSGTVVISNCYNTANIKATHSASGTVYAGGICGYIIGTITQCYNTGNIEVSGTTTNVGGIGGTLSNSTADKIENCYNTGNLSSSTGGSSVDYAYAGGILGGVLSAGTSAMISNCYSTGNISSTRTGAALTYSGGICGRYGNIKNCFVANCQITNVNDAPRARIGRVGGADGTYTNNHVYGMTTLNGNAITSSVANTKDGKDALTTNFQTQSWFTTNLSTWDFTNVWEIISGNYPTLIGVGTPPAPTAVTVTAASNNTALGTATGSGTYDINATVTLHALAALNSTFTGWSDGNNTNPRTITATADITLTATFASCDNSALLAKIAALETDTAALKAQIKTLQDQLNTANTTISTLQTDKSNLQTLLNNANSTITTLQTDKTNLQNALNTANSTISALQSEISDLQTELDECKTSTGDEGLRSAPALSLYPNPTTGIVYLNTLTLVKVYTQQGVLLQETTADSVDLSPYAAGLYLLQVGGEWVKVIKK